MLELRGKEWLADIQQKAVDHTSWKMSELEVMLEKYETRTRS